MPTSWICFTSLMGRTDTYGVRAGLWQGWTSRHIRSAGIHRTSRHSRLAVNGMILPVRLALFFLVFQGRKWTTQSLKDIGAN